MAFALKNNTILGTPSLVSPSGQLATAANFFDPYSYDMNYQPDLLATMHLKRGKGKLTKFSQIVGNQNSYAADEVKHAEMGDLHTVSTAVTVVGDVFTCPLPHQLRVKDEVMISDGTVEKYAIVSEVTSPTVFVGENVDAGAFGFAGAVTVSAYSNSFGKGEGNFTQGHEWTPEYFSNYTQIIKAYSDINESDMAAISWVKAPMFPGGEGWYNVAMARTLDKYDNVLEMTQTFHRRAAATSAAAVAGLPRGMKGIIQQVEERGNIGNEYLTTIEDYSNIARRIKQQGGSTSYTVWCDHTQMAYNRAMLAGVNSAYAAGSNYGTFQNGKDMALALDFKSIYIDGITFHFTSWDILDDKQLLGSANFVNTSVAALFVPSGDGSVLEDGNTVSKPFLELLYRRRNGIDRYKKTEIFGGNIGTPHKLDKMEAHYKTEQTNRLVGANKFFVIRKGTGIYSGS